MEIRVLASGSAGNAYTVTDGETSLLIECGIPWRRLQELTDYTVSDSAACLVSHEHKDHCKAAADVAKAGVDIYTSPGTAVELGVESRRVHAVGPLEEFTVGTWTVKPFDVQHDCAQPFGYLLRSLWTNERLLFATDTYYIKYRFPGLTHIMIEANYDYGLMDPGQADLNKRVMRSHMSLENLQEFIKANDMTKLQQIYLLHLSDERSDEEAFRQSVAMLTGAEVYTA